MSQSFGSKENILSKPNRVIEKNKTTFFHGEFALLDSCKVFNLEETTNFLCWYCHRNVVHRKDFVTQKFVQNEAGKPNSVYKVAPNTPNTRGGTWLIKWLNDQFPSLVAVIYIQWMIGAIMVYNANFACFVDYRISHLY